MHVVAVGGEYHLGIETTTSHALFEETLQELEDEARKRLDEQVRKIEEAGGKVAKAHLRIGGERTRRLLG